MHVIIRFLAFVFKKEIQLGSPIGSSSAFIFFLAQTRLQTKDFKKLIWQERTLVYW